MSKGVKKKAFGNPKAFYFLAPPIIQSCSTTNSINRLSFLYKLSY